MGSCVSSVEDDTQPAHRQEPAVPRSRRSLRNSSGKLEPSAKADAGVPGCVAEPPEEQSLAESGAPPLAPFDPSLCSPAVRRWFDALCRCTMSSDRRAAIHNALGHTEKQAAGLRGASATDLNGAFFVGIQDTVTTLDIFFDECVAASDDDTDIDATGIEFMASRLGVSEVAVLFFIHLLDCGEGPWTVRREHFMTGCMRLLVPDDTSLQQCAVKAKEEYEGLTVSSPAFAAFYRFLFTFVKQPAARCISADVATGLWESVLQPKWAGGDQWLEYVKEHAPEKPVFRDLWMQLGFFAESVTWPGCPEADDDSAWPSLIDGFVDYVRHPPKPTG